jgi:hypothetical protein
MNSPECKKIVHGRRCIDWDKVEAAVGVKGGLCQNYWTKKEDVLRQEFGSCPPGDEAEPDHQQHPPVYARWAGSLKRRFYDSVSSQKRAIAAGERPCIDWDEVAVAIGGAKTARLCERYWVSNWKNLCREYGSSPPGDEAEVRDGEEQHEAAAELDEGGGEGRTGDGVVLAVTEQDPGQWSESDSDETEEKEESQVLSDYRAGGWPRKLMDAIHGREWPKGRLFLGRRVPDWHWVSEKAGKCWRTCREYYYQNMKELESAWDEEHGKGRGKKDDVARDEVGDADEGHDGGDCAAPAGADPDPVSGGTTADRTDDGRPGDDCGERSAQSEMPEEGSLESEQGEILGSGDDDPAPIPEEESPTDALDAIPLVDAPRADGNDDEGVALGEASNGVESQFDGQAVISSSALVADPPAHQSQASEIAEKSRVGVATMPIESRDDHHNRGRADDFGARMAEPLEIVASPLRDDKVYEPRPEERRLFQEASPEIKAGVADLLRRIEPSPRFGLVDDEKLHFILGAGQTPVSAEPAPTPDWDELSHDVLGQPPETNESPRWAGLRPPQTHNYPATYAPLTQKERRAAQIRIREQKK